MDLAVVAHCAGREQQVRLKLHFDDATILSSQQIHEGLCESWFLLGRHLHSIADLASNIVIAFDLGSSCPHGISLRMENFTLPPSQPAGLLKDKDVVSINRKVAPPHQQGKHAYSSSFDTFEKIAPLGVIAPAIEEFERETGGYESEAEEEKDICKNLLKDVDNKALKRGSMKSQEKKREREKVEGKTIPSSTIHHQVNYADSPLENLGKEVNDKVLKGSTAKSREKKRKREKVERFEEKGLEVVPYMGGVTNKKDKGNNVKKQRLEDQQVESEKLQGTTKRQECQISREGQNSDCSKAARIKEEKKDKAVLNKDDDPIEKNTAEKQMMVFGSKENASVSMSGSSSDEKVKHKEKIPGLHIDNEIVKKCSRSTIRKKAKRRRKRENPEFTTKFTSRQGDDPVEVDKTGTEQVRFFAPTKHEDDGDAEEERLPRLVKPGHIRFQDSDEDDNDSLDPLQKPLPCLRWSNGISKRKGQSWGQEKTKRGNNNFQAMGDMELDDIQGQSWGQEKTERGNNNFQAMGDMELDDIQELKPETLPAFEGTPQIGDVIAYRILELTPSYCPELSEYRVGRVLDLESQSGKLKLADVPKYSTQRRDDQNSTVYEDGVLETDISSLAEVRLVERSELEATVQASIEIPVNDIERKLHMATDTTMDISKTCNTYLISAEAGQQIEKRDSAPFEGWLEISDALRRKRDELGRKVETTAANHGNDQELQNENQPESEMTMATRIADLRNNEELESKQEMTSTKSPELGKPKFENENSSAGKRSSNSVRAGRARGWYRRAGGLGSTMALLRSQNVTDPGLK